MLAAGRSLAAVALALVLLRASAIGQVAILRLTPPPEFSRAAGDVPQMYLAASGDAAIHVYPFRSFHGSMESEFRRSLLRDGIAPEFREVQVAAMLALDTLTVSGAQAAIVARFEDNRAGTLRERLRLAVLAGTSVAIVDVTASSLASWQRYWPGIQRMLESLRVDAAPDAPNAAAGPTPGGRRPGTGNVAGLYIGSVQRFAPSFGGPAGSGHWYLGTAFYLFSADGRVFRGYDLPEAPGGDIRRFDFARAQREDPENSGTYTVQRDRVIMSINGETTVATRSGDQLEIEGTKYER